MQFIYYLKKLIDQTIINVKLKKLLNTTVHLRKEFVEPTL
jgi:hypothetical protein